MKDVPKRVLTSLTMGRAWETLAFMIRMRFVGRLAFALGLAAWLPAVPGARAKGGIFAVGGNRRSWGAQGLVCRAGDQLGEAGISDRQRAFGGDGVRRDRA